MKNPNSARFAFRKWLAQAFGSSDPLSLIVVFILLLSFSILSSAIESFVQEFDYWRVAAVLIFSAIMFVFIFLARRWNRDLLPTVITDEQPPQAKMLIFFLSPAVTIGTDEEKQKAMAKLAEITGKIADQDVRKAISGSWRMPMEAIAYHKDRLKSIIVIGSSDSTSKITGKFTTGTHTQTDLFKSLVNATTDDLDSPPVVLTISEFLSDTAYERGVDFESVEDCQEALNQIYRHAREKNLDEADILVDMTGGQKPNTAASVAAAILIRRRRFQYVSTRDYKVRTFDVTMRYDP
ncbi:MAG: hypothetical protein H6843_06830 [Rhodospirillaceae bacterium]|nr:hypothetical protein [Rhodospirillaceae bacterium]